LVLISEVGHVLAPKITGIFIEYFLLKSSWSTSFFVMILATIILTIF